MWEADKKGAVIERRDANGKQEKGCHSAIDAATEVSLRWPVCY